MPATRMNQDKAVSVLRTRKPALRTHQYRHIHPYLRYYEDNATRWNHALWVLMARLREHDNYRPNRHRCSAGYALDG